MNTDVTLIFGTTNKLLSRLIRWVTRSRTSHATLGLEINGVPLILEATTGGVRIIPRAKWLIDHILVAEFRPKIDLSHGLRDALTHIGAAYDYVGLFGYFWVLLGRRLGKKLRNPLASERAMVCSEFVMHLDTGEKIPEWKDMDWEATTPEDLLKSCEASTQSFEPCVAVALTAAAH